MRPTSKKRKKALPNGLMRVLFAALALCAIVAFSAGMTTLLQPPNLDVLAEPTDSAPTADPTLSPEPTATPTPAVYAPFGAQYGYGGADLIPKTPTPDPAQSTPIPTAEPTPAPTVKAARTLKKGSTGEDVKKLQQSLIDLGYLSDTADGTFGAKTQDAVTLFQAVNGLDADGLAGAKTQALLFSGTALSADQAPPTDFLVLVNRSTSSAKQMFRPIWLKSLLSSLPTS